jgi:hypothetical protein
VATGGDDEDLPPPWLDVTAALQYLVSGGALELYPGVSKKGLMGFADVAPEGTEKRLSVGFFYNGALMEKDVGDSDMLKLPSAGAPVRDAARAERLRARLQAVVAAAVGGSSGAGGGGGSGASSRRGSAAALVGGGGGGP